MTLYCYCGNKIETLLSYLVKLFDIKVSCSMKVEEGAKGDIFCLICGEHVVRERMTGT